MSNNIFYNKYCRDCNKSFLAANYSAKCPKCKGTNTSISIGKVLDMLNTNPKVVGSNIIDCIPQKGPCRIGCNQCYYNRAGAFYRDIAKPYFPPVEATIGKIVRVNSGHDSNVEREHVIESTKQYEHKFYNTSQPDFDFPAPVVYTANAKEEQKAWMPSDILKFQPKHFHKIMFVRLRVSSTNIPLVIAAAKEWTDFNIPVVLTFMRYYDNPPHHTGEYEWKKHILNSYWCPTKSFMYNVLSATKNFVDRRLITMCGTLDSSFCKDCRNCETFYWQTHRNLLFQKMKKCQ